ncbi:hypothetical protein ABT126_39005 [Streptomyces sp. NPDC002012]
MILDIAAADEDTCTTSPAPTATRATLRRDKLAADQLAALAALSVDWA